jgi:hypothetical protein
VPGKRGNRRSEVLGLDLSGYPTYRALARRRGKFGFTMLNLAQPLAVPMRTTHRLGAFVVALLMAVSLLACGRNKRDFSPVGPVTTANLWVSASDGSKYGFKISDPKDLSRIVTFVDSQRANWGTPWFGIPVPFVEVQLFDGQQTKGSFGVGKDFFETQREGGFFSKNTSPSEIHNFLDALNLDDATLRNLRSGADGSGKRD